MLIDFQCVDCKHLHPWRYGKSHTCNAFPKGIPRAVMFGDVSHTAPYRGDHGIQFEAGRVRETREQIDAMLNGEEVDLIPYALRNASSRWPDAWSEERCIAHAAHAVDYVRAEALHCMAGLARRGYGLSEARVRPLIEKALSGRQGTSEWAAALTAALAVEDELGWQMGAHEIDTIYQRQWFPDYQSRPIRWPKPG